MSIGLPWAEHGVRPNTGSVRTFGAEHGVRPYLWSAEPKLAWMMRFSVQASGGYGLTPLMR